ncbi:hypothetical protein F5879DRAFT_987529 [Lentinula edodes]|nr:hypothetical protein F5879DRAFT_987529 [Lentinula edodes]
MGRRISGRSPDIHVVPKIFFVEVRQIPASPIVYHLSSQVKLFTAMSFDRPCRSTSRTSSPLLPALTSLGEVASPDPESDGEVEQDQLAFTIESPSRPQLQLFETVFNTGKPLSAYCEDDPLWSLLAAVASVRPGSE